MAIDEFMKETGWSNWDTREAYTWLTDNDELNRKLEREATFDVVRCADWLENNGANTVKDIARTYKSDEEYLNDPEAFINFDRVNWFEVAESFISEE